IRRGLYGIGHHGVRVVLKSRGVGDVLLLSLGDISQDEAGADRTGCQDAITVEWQPLGVGQSEIGGDCAVGSDLDRLNRYREPWPNEIRPGRIQVICFVVAREWRFRS